MTKEERTVYFRKLAAKGGRNRAKALDENRRREIAMMGVEARLLKKNRSL